jgi:hypothetical protein
MLAWESSSLIDVDSNVHVPHILPSCIIPGISSIGPSDWVFSKGPVPVTKWPLAFVGCPSESVHQCASIEASSLENGSHNSTDLWRMEKCRHASSTL